MANWSNPLLTSTYTNFVTEVKDRDTDLALQFDGTTSTNIPTNAIRWNSSVNRWQKWNGSTWGELTSTYALTGLTTTSNASIGGTLGSGAFTSTGSVSGTALLPTGNTVPTNGIYLPSANVLGIATSSTARLIIDASGNFGIGTLSPATGLHVGTVAASATSGNLYIGPTTAGQARLRLFNGGGQAEWLLGQKTSSDHAFKLSKSVAGSESDYLTVDTVGNVGIGTSAPQSKLDLGLGTDGARQISWHTDASTSYANIWSSYNGARTTIANGLKGSTTVPNGFESSVSALWGRAATEWDYGKITFYTAAPSTVAYGTAITPSERMRIDSSGRVGIGTSSPQAALHVNGTELRVETSATAEGFVRFVNASGSMSFGMSGAVGNAVLLFDRTNNQSAYTYSGGASGSHTWSTNNIERMRVDSSGRVGIGTSTPLAPIHVGSTPTGTSNIYVAPTTAGLAAVEVYNGGPTCGWRTGQRSSSDHDWSLDQMVAGVAYNKFQITATGVLKFDSGYGSAAAAYGCRAWVTFTGTGTVTIRASANVSSVTDIGVGDYTVNFTTAMPDANYAVATNSSDTNASRSFFYAIGSARILTYDTGIIDSGTVSVAIFR